MKRVITKMHTDSELMQFWEDTHKSVRGYWFFYEQLSAEERQRVANLVFGNNKVEVIDRIEEEPEFDYTHR